MKLDSKKMSWGLIFLLLALLINISCKREEAIQSQPVIIEGKWTRMSDFVIPQQIYDSKILKNGNIAVLADEYYVLDSLFNLASVYELYQSSIPSHQAKRLSNPFYSNRNSSDGRSKYLIQNYFNETNGSINSQSITEFSTFFDLSEKGWGMLLDDVEDKILNNSIRLFLRTDQDTLPHHFNQHSLLTKNEVRERNNSFQPIIIGTEYNRIACTKRKYLLYNTGNYSGLKFLDPSFISLDTNIYKQTVESVFANDNAFYIKNTNGLYETVGGETFLKIAESFNPKCLLSNNLMFGENNYKPCILNLTTRALTYLPTVGLPRTTLNEYDYAIGINGYVVLFCKEGVYRIKY